MRPSTIAIAKAAYAMVVSVLSCELIEVTSLDFAELVCKAFRAPWMLLFSVVMADDVELESDLSRLQSALAFAAFTAVVMPETTSARVPTV